MALFTTLFLVTMPILTSGAWNRWSHPGSHGSKPFSEVAAMTSGKIFGVSDGDLWENYYSNGKWRWINHKRPSKKLAVIKPCVFNKEKLFVISSSGELYERVYVNWIGVWKWVSHGSPNGVTIKQSGCACVSYSHNSVFVVGSDNQLHERIWLNRKWQWRTHNKLPSNEKINDSPIDVFDCHQCLGSIFVVSTTGTLYRFSYSSPTPINGAWYNLGHPTNDKAVSVTATNTVGGGIFVTTSDNKVCEYLPSTNTFTCYGTPDGSEKGSSPISISKSVYTTQNCKNLSPGKYLFVNGMSPIFNSRSGVTRLEITGTSHKFVYHTSSQNNCCDHIGAPEIILNKECPKVFNVQDDGAVYQYAWN